MNDNDIELARRELARRSLLGFRRYLSPDYAVNWHNRLIAKKLDDVAEGRIKRLIITCPPRSGKSHLVSEAFPAYFLGKYPGPQNPIISTSYSAELAQNFGRKVRNIMQSREYLNVFPEAVLASDSKAVDKLSTVQGSEYVAVGMGGAITGRGARISLIDDPVKNAEEAQSQLIRDKHWEWFQSTLYTRLMPGGAIIIVMTRWHTDDIVGRILSTNSEAWELVELPAIATHDDEFRKVGDALWPEWYPVDTLRETEAAVGPYVWSALYQCSPVTESNQEFKSGWLKYRTTEEIDALRTSCYITVDAAMSKKDSADWTGFSVIRVDGENKWNVRAWHERLNPEELTAKLFELNEKYRPTAIGIEKMMFTVGLKPYVDSECRRKNVFLPIKELEHHQSKKEVRIRGLIPLYSSGSIYHEVDACTQLENEMRSFPHGKNDDIIDSLAYGLHLCRPPGFAVGSIHTHKQNLKPYGRRAKR